MNLLPCPFCGGSPMSQQYSKTVWRVVCGTCHVKFEVKVFKFSIQWAKEKCESNWNKRQGGVQ